MKCTAQKRQFLSWTKFFDFRESNKPLPGYRKGLMDDLHVIGTKHLCIEIKNLDAFVKELKQKGVEPQKISQAGFGGRFTFIKDNNGILIELYEK